MSNTIRAADREDKRVKRVTLKTWYQLRVSRLGKDKQLLDFAIYGPLSTFYYAARSTFGSELAMKPRTEWNELYQEYTTTGTLSK